MCNKDNKNEQRFGWPKECTVYYSIHWVSSEHFSTEGNAEKPAELQIREFAIDPPYPRLNRASLSKAALLFDSSETLT